MASSLPGGRGVNRFDNSGNTSSLRPSGQGASLWWLRKERKSLTSSLLHFSKDLEPNDEWTRKITKNWSVHLIYSTHSWLCISRAHTLSLDTNTLHRYTKY